MPACCLRARSDTGHKAAADRTAAGWRTGAGSFRLNSVSSSRTEKKVAISFAFDAYNSVAARALTARLYPLALMIGFLFVCRIIHCKEVWIIVWTSFRPQTPIGNAPERAAPSAIQNTHACPSKCVRVYATLWCCERACGLCVGRKLACRVTSSCAFSCAMRSIVRSVNCANSCRTATRPRSCLLASEINKLRCLAWQQRGTLCSSEGASRTPNRRRLQCVMRRVHAPQGRQRGVGAGAGACLVHRLCRLGRVTLGVLCFAFGCREELSVSGLVLLQGRHPRGSTRGRAD